jgi:hypothetical protein
MESAASLKYGGFPRCDFRGSRLTSMPSIFKGLRSNLTYLRVRFPFVHPFAKSQQIGFPVPEFSNLPF